MIVGYARVSTADQNTEAQIPALKGAKCKRIYQEEGSGRTMDRPELEKCLDNLEAGDTLSYGVLTVSRDRSVQQVLSHLRTAELCPETVFCQKMFYCPLCVIASVLFNLKFLSNVPLN